MKQFKQYIEEEYLTEGSTVDAVTVEASICIAYNMHKAGTPWDASMAQGIIKGKADPAYVAAAEKAGIASKALKKIKTDPEGFMLKATNTIESAGIGYNGLGPSLDHSGRGNAGTNFYASASDKTPKSDFWGSNEHQVSLKLKGGAQLMSAASSEAKGVVNAALLHYANSPGGKDLSQSKEMVKAMEILGETMKNAGSNTMNVEVGKSKNSFVDWYITYEGTIGGNKSRRLVVKGLMNNPRDTARLEQHLKNELKMWRIPDADKSAPGKLLGACYGDKMGSSKYPDVKSRKEPMCGGEGKNPDMNWDWEKGIMADGAVVAPVTKAELKQYTEMYIASKKADVSVDSIGVNPDYLKKDNVDAAMLTDKALKTQVAEVLSVAMDSVGWQAEVKKAFDVNTAFKEYIVYEAASGLYKFTGTVSDGKNYGGGEPSVATEILTFTGGVGGGVLHKDIMVWSKGKAGIVDNLNISYKGSGRNRYIALKLMTDSVYNHELPTLMEAFDNIEREYLTEGWLGNIAKKVADTAKKVASAVVDFMKRVYEKVAQRLMGLLKMTANAFMDMMGLEISGGYVRSPF